MDSHTQKMNATHSGAYVNVLRRSAQLLNFNPQNPSGHYRSSAKEDMGDSPAGWREIHQGFLWACWCPIL
jgi:hypothetical protein